MSPRTRSTFAKRQKEQARQEKQRAKAQRKLQRKLESQTRLPADDGTAYPETGASTGPESGPQPDALSESSMDNTQE